VGVLQPARRQEKAHSRSARRRATWLGPDRPGPARGGVVVAAVPRAARSTGSWGEDSREPTRRGDHVVRLAEFITANQEAILVEWEAFARTRGAAGGGMDVAALRDHAAEMLAVIAADLNTPQGSDAQAEKGKGRAPAEPRAADGGTDRLTAAAEHGAGRAESGFTVEEMVSEFRALRASVMRLWTAARTNGRDGVCGALDATAAEDLTPRRPAGPARLGRGRAAARAHDPPRRADRGGATAHAARPRGTRDGRGPRGHRACARRPHGVPCGRRTLGSHGIPRDGGRARRLGRARPTRVTAARSCYAASATGPAVHFASRRSRSRIDPK
jgi:hypothetical protein